MKKGFWKSVWPSLKDSFKGFSDHKITKLSASLAYYTVFSLGPLLVVIIALCSIFFGQEAVQGTIYDQLKNFIGSDAAEQIQTIIKNASLADKGGFALVIGIVTLLIGATTVFGELQDSMNSIWGVKARPKSGIMKLLKDRLLSFGLIASLGFLLLVSLAVTAVVEGIGHRVQAMFPDVAVTILYVINLIVTLVVVTVLFSVLFKVLPDVKLKLKDIWPGAVATALLFMIGKFGISVYISKTNVGSTFGSAGSLVILLIWVYYSAIIVYFGAEFTKAFALRRGADVKPSPYSEWDDKPAIAGAAHPDANISADAKAKHEHKKREPAPPGFIHETTNQRLLPATTSYSKTGHNTRRHGIGTALLGLALYFITGGAKKKAVTKS